VSTVHTDPGWNMRGRHMQPERTVSTHARMYVFCLLTLYQTVNEPDSHDV